MGATEELLGAVEVALAPSQQTAQRIAEKELARTEDQISAPDFWSQPEVSQKVMQERKRLEESIESDKQVAGIHVYRVTLKSDQVDGESNNGREAEMGAVVSISGEPSVLYISSTVSP